MAAEAWQQTADVGWLEKMAAKVLREKVEALLAAGRASRAAAPSGGASRLLLPGLEVAAAASARATAALAEAINRAGGSELQAEAAAAAAVAASFAETFERLATVVRLHFYRNHMLLFF